MALPISESVPVRLMNRAALSVAALATGAIVWFGLVIEPQATLITFIPRRQRPAPFSPQTP